MKKPPRFCSRPAFLALVLAAAHGHAAAQEATTTVILVRHAERATEPRDDPGLSAEGVARATALVHALGKSGISAIYSTRYARTRATAAPLARALGLEVRLVEAAAMSGAGSDAAQLAERIRRDHRGATVLIVGHSNTVPAIIDALGAGPAGTIKDDEYDNLFIVLLRSDGSARLVRAKYGERSGPS